MNISKQSDPEKQARVAILMSNKADFRLKLVRRDNEGHVILKEQFIKRKL
jgi:hypothetical protein